MAVKLKELISHFARKREIWDYTLQLFHLLLVWEDIASIYSHMSTHHPTQGLELFEITSESLRSHWSDSEQSKIIFYADILMRNTPNKVFDFGSEKNKVRGFIVHVSIYSDE